MQGIHTFIPTELKIRYLNALLRVGFDTLDFGSFVSPRAIPQLADTAEVLRGLDLAGTQTHLLAIVANLRGAEEASAHAPIRYLGYPFSVSETFQLRNTQKTIAQSMELLREMQALCTASGKELVVYLSMGFGNPYGDPWNPEMVKGWAHEIAALGVRTLSLADTVGNAVPETIGPLFETLIPALPGIEWGAHFHSAPATRQAKLEAAWQAGCRRFDSALRGFGGCPFAEDVLVGNMATESLLAFLGEKGAAPATDAAAWQQAMLLSAEVFAHE